MTEARHGKYIEIVATSKQARGLKRDGVSATLKRDRQGRTVTRAAQGDGPGRRLLRDYRPYWDDTYVGPRTARATRARRSTRSCRRSPPRGPTWSSRWSSATSVNGMPILALKVTKDARTTPDGQRPAVLYSSNQHAREWITSESNRRLVAPVRRQLHEPDRHDAGGIRPRRRQGRGRRPDQGRPDEDRQRQRALVRRRRPTPTATTSRSPTATACGARTCATTTGRGDHAARRRRPQPQLPRPSGAMTTRAPPTIRPARRSAARRRSPSPRRRRSTA